MTAGVTYPASRAPGAAGARPEGSSELFTRGGSFKRRVLRLMLAQGAGIKWIIGGALLESTFDVAAPWLSSKVIDVALPDQATHLLAIIVALVVALALHTAWAGWLHEKIEIVLLARVEAECLDLVLERLLRTPFERSQGRDFGNTSETMAAVSTTSVALIRAVVTLTTQSLSIVLMLALLAASFPGLTALVVAMSFAMIAMASGYAAREARLAEVTLEASSRQQQTLHVLLRAVATLRVSGATERFLAHWKRQLLGQTHASISQQGANVSRGVVFEAFPQLVALGATAWLVNAVIAGQASLGEMMMGSMLVGSVMGGFVSLVSSAVAFQAMRPQFERIDALLEDGERSEPARHAPSAGESSELSVDGVWFRYDERGRWVLEEQRCRFPAHQLTELRAASGAGKTTILRLLAGLLEPERGTVRVLGKAPHEVRHLITYLPQQSALLEASIATNLRVLSGRPLEESLEIARHTGLAQLLERLPMQAETLVSIAGGNLSAGQRQLVLLTAAFAAGRPVVLLDEATSQLDTESQRRIDWSALARDRTVVLVRHD